MMMIRQAVQMVGLLLEWRYFDWKPTHICPVKLLKTLQFDVEKYALGKWLKDEPLKQKGTMTSDA